MQTQSANVANIGYGVKGGIKKMQEVFEKIKDKAWIFQFIPIIGG